MYAGELTVNQLCDILEGRGLLTAQDRAHIQHRAPAQRAKLEALRDASDPSGRRPKAEIDAIDLISSMGVPNATVPDTLLGDVVIAEAIAAATGLRLMRFVPEMVDRELIVATLSRPFALRHSIVPMGMSGGTLIVAVASRLPDALLDELRRKTGTAVKQVICPKSDIRNIIRIAFPAPLEPPPHAGKPSSQSLPVLEVSPTRSSMPWIIGGAVGLVVLIGVVILIVVLATRHSAPEEPFEAVERPLIEGDRLEPAEVSPPVEASGAVDRPPPAAPGGPLHFRVKLQGVPRGATVRLDGEKIRRTTVNVPNDGREHRLEVRARGYEPWEHRLVATEDQEIDVELLREMVF